MKYNDFIKELEEKTGEKFTYYRIAKLTGKQLGTLYKRKIRNSSIPQTDIKILENFFNIKIQYQNQ